MRELKLVPKWQRILRSRGWTVFRTQDKQFSAVWYSPEGYVDGPMFTRTRSREVWKALRAATGVK